MSPSPPHCWGRGGPVAQGGTRDPQQGQRRGWFTSHTPSQLGEGRCVHTRSHEGCCPDGRWQ